MKRICTARKTFTLAMMVLFTGGVAFATSQGQKPEAFYVATNGSSNNTGTLDSPFATIKDACKRIKPGSTIKTIYVRGGVYSNPGYGSGDKNNRSIPVVDCNGSSKQYLTIRPYEDEKVKFAFDSFQGIRLEGNYLNFEGFEVEGPA